MKQATTVIELGTSKSICLIAEKNIFNESSILGIGITDYNCIKNGGLADYNDIIDSLTDSVKQADAQAHKRIKSAYICAPGEYTICRRRKCRLEFGKEKLITSKDIEKLFKTGEDKLGLHGYDCIHRSPVDFYLDGVFTMEPLGATGSVLEAEVSYIFLDVNFIKDTTEMLESLGIKVRDYISASLGQALLFVPPQERDGTAVILDMGYSVTSLSIVKGDGIIYHTNFDFGGRNLSRDLATVLNISYDYAEQLKRRCVYGLNISADDFYEVVDKKSMKLIKFSALEVHRIIEARLEEMLDI
ncbi:MAG TPA: cell division FtsA domain-containing protein, partial [Clostridia bacterium]|nr:cell division FtsA domain-containing protein [Clostridia bacterium]